MQIKPPIYNKKFNNIDNLDHLDPLIARILSARGIKKKEDYTYALSNLAPISSLEFIPEAVQLILDNKEKEILIVGDYDVDGATSTALLIRCLKDFGFNKINYIVPNRFDYGYGLTPKIVDEAKKLNPDLIITVDNGISSFDGVKEARNSKIDVLVTDHHLPGNELPDANVIVNPNLESSSFVSKNLAGVGVAFYVMAGLGKELEVQGNIGFASIPSRYLDLVALGTIADVVKLDLNNRILVDQGIKRIRKQRCISGINALILQSGRNPKKVSSTDLGFSLGPKINAAGRLEDMSVGIKCLLTDDDKFALECAEILDKKNKKRQGIEQKMQGEAFTFIEKFNKTNLPLCVCVKNKDWHQGLVGLVASRLKDHCNRPVIAFAHEEDGLMKGSARSIRGIHIKDLLESIATEKPHLIQKFGGHSMAAGLTIKDEHFDEFKVIASVHIKNLYPFVDLTGAIYVDGEIPSKKLSIDFARMIDQFGPWGSGFDEPIFFGKFYLLDQRVVGDKHLKIKVKSFDGKVIIDGIAFNQGSIISRDAVELIYKLQVNEFRGNVTAQLLVENIYS
ncbi:MAG: single-stranded-DNA-specific exonuclease RecJ [Woeseiaceae bacterium]|nr:single-stranded-DNA-specific exonuclease RecJ [Woeseiaceae bacterium]